MYIGEQLNDLSDENLAWAAQMGVAHIAVNSTHGPGREADIEIIKQNVRAAGEAGVPCLKYNLNLLGVPRTGRSPGRGGVTYSQFDASKWTDTTPTEFGPRNADQVWEAITY